MPGCPEHPREHSPSGGRRRASHPASVVFSKPCNLCSERALGHGSKHRWRGPGVLPEGLQELKLGMSDFLPREPLPGDPQRPLALALTSLPPYRAGPRPAHWKESVSLGAHVRTQGEGGFPRAPVALSSHSELSSQDS